MINQIIAKCPECERNAILRPDSVVLVIAESTDENLSYYKFTCPHTDCGVHASRRATAEIIELLITAQVEVTWADIGNEQNGAPLPPICIEDLEKFTEELKGMSPEDIMNCLYGRPGNSE